MLQSGGLLTEQFAKQAFSGLCVVESAGAPKVRRPWKPLKSCLETMNGMLTILECFLSVVVEEEHGEGAGACAPTPSPSPRFSLPGRCLTLHAI